MAFPSRNEARVEEVSVTVEVTDKPAFFDVRIVVVLGCQGGSTSPSRRPRKGNEKRMIAPPRPPEHGPGTGGYENGWIESVSVQYTGGSDITSSLPRCTVY